MIEMSKITRTGMIIVLLLACTGAASAASFDNGGFEKPLVIPPLTWNIFADNTLFLVWDVQWAPDSAAAAIAYDPKLTLANAEFQKVGAISITPAEGDQYAELDTDWDGNPGVGATNEKANVIISQTFDTVPSALYHVSYYQRCRESLSNCDLKFDWTGVPSVTTSGVLGVWTPFSFDLTAAGSQTTISFTGLGTPDSYGALLDGVVVTKDPEPPIPTPEFPTMALPAAMIVGLLGAVLFVQKSKEQ
jgi:hypothetical protein